MKAIARTSGTCCSVMAAAVLLTADPAEVKAAPQKPSALAEVGFVVIRDNGSGSATAAQRYLDTLFASIAHRNQWSGAQGKYFTSRAKAELYITKSKPSFGFMSFGAYLGLRKAHGLKPVAVADAGAVGGAQFFIVSKSHISLDQCKGKALATNHADDPRFIDAVVSGDAFDLADFKLVPTKRPVQTLKAVLNGDAECALVDDAQVVAMKSVDGGAGLRPVWSSAEMPAVVVVSFASTPAKQAKVFGRTVEQICDGDGRDACDAAGLDAPRKVSADAFSKLQAAYDG